MAEQEMSWPEVIEAAKEKFIQVAPVGIDFIAERAYAVQLLNNNDYLKRVATGHPQSLQTAILNVAAIGLSLNPAKKQAYLIPRTVKHGSGRDTRYVSKVFLEASYVGLCDLATQSGAVLWVQSRIVYAEDSFIDNGPGMLPTHTYDAFKKERGAFAGVYCVAKTKDGDFLTEVMRADEIYAIRDRSEAWKQKMEKEAKGEKGFGGPWETDFNEQARKTVVRRAYKMWPHSPTMERLAQAIELSNQNEGFEPILTSPNLGEYTAQQKDFFDHLITKSDALGMLIFRKSIGEAIFTNLYHSFEKGQKGKYQRIVDELYNQGNTKVRELTNALQEAAMAGHDGSIAEMLEGLSSEVVEHLMDEADQDTAAVMRQVIQNIQ